MAVRTGLAASRMAAVIEAMDVPVVITDPEGNIVAVNKDAATRFDIPKVMVHGQELMTALHVAEPDHAHRSMAEGIETTGRWQGRLLRKLESGMNATIEISSYLLHNDNGTKEGALCFIEPGDQTKAEAHGQTSRSNEQLCHALSAMESVYDAAPIGIGILDTNRRFVKVNRMFGEMSGLSPVEHEGRAIDIAPFISTVAENIAGTVLATGRPLFNLEVEAEISSKPGDIRTLNESWVPLTEDSRTTGIAVVIEDATDKRRQIGQLEDAKARLEAILNQMPMGMYILEAPSGKVVFVNSEVFRMFRGEFDHAIIRGVADFEKFGAFWPDGRQVRSEDYPVARSLRKGEVIRDELFTSLRADGSKIWFRNSSAPVRNAKGEIAAAVTMMIDVTDQVETQDKIVELMRTSETERIRLQMILDTLPIGIMIMDHRGKLLTENLRNREIWGGGPSNPPSTLSDYQPYSIWSIESGDMVPEVEQPTYRVLVLGQTVNGERYDMRRFDGSTGQIMVSGAPIRDKDEGIVGGVIVMQDISDLQRIEVELAERAKELARSNTELQQFAYIASHDLREPLRMVSSYLGLLEHKYKGKVLDEKAEEYIHFASDGSVRMQQMINDLLTYSRIDTAERSFVPTDLNDVVKVVSNNLNMAIKENDAVVDSTSLPTIWADRPQMVQLFQNLLDNALKYRGEARPRVEIAAFPRGDSWLISVKDNGVGIPPSMHERIFQMFQRGYTHEERPGTGIGLAIAKKIAERHGGRIWVESEEGKGSTFKLLLPEKPHQWVRGKMSHFPDTTCGSAMWSKASKGSAHN